MGWSYGWPDKGSLVEYLRTKATKVVDSSLRGNNLWMVAEDANGERYILLCLLDGTPGAPSGDPYRWGYKDISESMGPTEVNCPLRFLEMTPVPDSTFAVGWRDRVREYHARAAHRRSRFKHVKQGDTVTLRGVRGEFRVTSLDPFLGVRDGTTYRLIKSRVE